MVPHGLLHLLGPLDLALVPGRPLFLNLLGALPVLLKQNPQEARIGGSAGCRQRGGRGRGITPMFAKNTVANSNTRLPHHRAECRKKSGFPKGSMWPSRSPHLALKHGLVKVELLDVVVDGAAADAVNLRVDFLEAHQEFLVLLKVDRLVFVFVLLNAVKDHLSCVDPGEERDINRRETGPVKAPSCCYEGVGEHREAMQSPPASASHAICSFPHARTGP